MIRGSFISTQPDGWMQETLPTEHIPTCPALAKLKHILRMLCGLTSADGSRWDLRIKNHVLELITNDVADKAFGHCAGIQKTDNPSFILHIDMGQQHGDRICATNKNSGSRKAYGCHGCRASDISSLGRPSAGCPWQRRSRPAHHYALFTCLLNS